MRECSIARNAENYLCTSLTHNKRWQHNIPHLSFSEEKWKRLCKHTCKNSPNSGSLIYHTALKRRVQPLCPKTISSRLIMARLCYLVFDVLVWTLQKCVLALIQFCFIVTILQHCLYFHLCDHGIFCYEISYYFIGLFWMI